MPRPCRPPEGQAASCHSTPSPCTGRQPRTPTRAARWWGGKKGGTLSPQADPSLAGAFSPWTGRYQPQKREILLLNSLRQLLVAANSTNGMLEGWCRPGPKQGLRDRKPGANPAEPTPSFGAQFKQVRARSLAAAFTKDGR